MQKCLRNRSILTSYYFWFITGNIHCNWSEHTTNFAARYTNWYTTKKHKMLTKKVLLYLLGFWLHKNKLTSDRLWHPFFLPEGLCPALNELGWHTLGNRSREWQMNGTSPHDPLPTIPQCSLEGWHAYWTQTFPWHTQFQLQPVWK